LIERNNLSLADIEYAGVTAPGTVNPELGIVEYAPNLPFVNYPLEAKFKELLPVARVLVANDANAAALGEALAGAARGTRSSVMITLGTGVGGGVILDGRIFTGGLNHSGAELGHTVIVTGGRLCGCGRRGCLETYASATGLVKLTRERIAQLKKKRIPSRLCDVDRVSGRTAFSLSKEGDKEAMRVVDEYISYLAIGVTNMINIFQPEVLLIGGGISGEGDYLIEPLRRLVDQQEYTRRNAVRTKILKAELGNDAGIIGAAGLGKQA
jgi:glucokinase